MNAWWGGILDFSWTAGHGGGTPQGGAGKGPGHSGGTGDHERGATASRTPRGSSHAYKYRLAFVVEGDVVVRFDNEAGKGDHWHRGTTQRPWDLTTLTTLLTDFWRAIHDGRAPRKARHSREELAPSESGGGNPGY